MTRQHVPRLLAALALVLGSAPAASASLTATVGTDGAPETNTIVIAADDGSGRRILAGGAWSSLSPDGTRVAVVEYDAAAFPAVSARLAVHPVTGGAPAFTIPATDLDGIVWSPDATKLAAADAQGDRLLLIDPATGATTTLATGDIASPSFAPDSSRLAFVRQSGRTASRGGTLEVIDLATRALTTLHAHASAPVWGPNAIAFATVTRGSARADRYDISVVRPDGTDRRRLTRIRMTSRFFGLEPLAWSADGRRLLSRVIGADGARRNAYGVDAVRGGARLIARGVIPSAISRDGRSIIGQTGDLECCGFAHTNIVRIPWFGGTRRVLLRHAMAASSTG